MATRNLKEFELEGVRDTGEVIGQGSYGEVKELELRGLKCVGKKLHRLLYETASPREKELLLDRFAQECELLSRLHHPHIVQFLGVWFEQGSDLPVLVMEYLHTTLSSCLDKHGVLPEEISFGILRDVALGLRYLHERSPPIIHRDLSANNVLLTSDMKAKISDLGVAKILNMTPAQASRATRFMLTKSPGTPCYMPPEALAVVPKYTTALDAYSFGVVIIHVLCAEWPIPGDAFRHDPNDPDSLIPVKEVDRRDAFLKRIGSEHPLMGLICQCLSNAPPRRPTAAELLSRLEAVISATPSSSTNRVELLKELTEQKSLAESHKHRLAFQEEEIKSLKVKVESTPERPSSASQVSLLLCWCIITLCCKVHLTSWLHHSSLLCRLSLDNFCMRKMGLHGKSDCSHSNHINDIHLHNF